MVNPKLITVFLMFVRKLAISIGIFMLLLLGAGINGYTIEGEETGIPTPGVADTAFFSEEPLPSNPVPQLVSAKVTVTWNEENIWLVIVDSDEKDRCQSVPIGLGSSTCSSRSIDATAGGADDNNIEGFSWAVEEGEFYAGLGQKSTNAPDSVDVFYSVKLQISGYVAIVLIGISGACFGFAFTRK